MLRGFYTKLGQIMSGLDGGIIPREYVETLKVLQSDVPPEPLERMIEILESELGCKVEEVFSSFEPKPLGAASIGQVHRATLLDGTPVVVKIQYPETEKNFRLDIATLRSFCEVSGTKNLQASALVVALLICCHPVGRECSNGSSSVSFSCQCPFQFIIISFATPDSDAEW
jgi:predicted unusual protein kinase regulating ubiquinone biosynthesis (AarF/ABC1/UbiB family)